MYWTDFEKGINRFDSIGAGLYDARDVVLGDWAYPGSMEGFSVVARTIYTSPTDAVVTGLEGSDKILVNSVRANDGYDFGGSPQFFDNGYFGFYKDGSDYKLFVYQNETAYDLGAITGPAVAVAQYDTPFVYLPGVSGGNVDGTGSEYVNAAGIRYGGSLKAAFTCSNHGTITVAAPTAENPYPNSFTITLAGSELNSGNCEVGMYVNVWNKTRRDRWRRIKSFSANTIVVDMPFTQPETDVEVFISPWGFMPFTTSWPHPDVAPTLTMAQHQFRVFQSVGSKLVWGGLPVLEDMAAPQGVTGFANFNANGYAYVESGKGGAITALASFEDLLLIFKREGTFALQGTVDTLNNPLGAQIIELHGFFGASNQKCVSYTPLGIAYCNDAGIYLWDGQQAQRIDRNIAAETGRWVKIDWFDHWIVAHDAGGSMWKFDMRNRSWWRETVIDENTWSNYLHKTYGTFITSAGILVYTKDPESPASPKWQTDIARYRPQITTQYGHFDEDVSRAVPLNVFFYGRCSGSEQNEQGYPLTVGGEMVSSSGTIDNPDLSGGYNFRRRITGVGPSMITPRITVRTAGASNVNAAFVAHTVALDFELSDLVN